MATTHPNILLIVTDQQRIDTLGCYGNPVVKTPHIDSIAADGVRYENSFCPYPVCTPSRYSMISGLYVHEHRGWSNHCTLPPGTETFPSILRNAGYKTKAVGKMHYTPTYADVGFNEMLLAEQHGPGRWDDDYHRDLRRLGLIDINDLEDQVEDFRKLGRKEYRKLCGALPSNLPEEHHSTTWIGNHAVRELEQWSASGNLLVASFVKPHHPHDPPLPWSEIYDPASVPLLPGWTEQLPAHDRELPCGHFPDDELTADVARRITAMYYGNVSHVDQHVGRMLETLKRRKLYNDTLIIYTSDHGDYLGFHHQMLKGRYMYDPLIKVPLLMKLPRFAAGHRGTSDSRLVSNIDLAPTILGQAGCKPGASMSGLDLARMTTPREFVFAETRWSTEHFMVRSHNRKLLADRTKKKSFFYDLEQDPLEMQNVYGDRQYEAETRRFEQALLDWRGAGQLPDFYLDEDAPCINQPNVPSRKDNHRAEMIEYMRAKWDETVRS